MSVQNLSDFLLWCFVLNFGLLLWWFLMFTLAHDLVYRIHGKMFRISKDRFNEIHYQAMAFFKLIVFVFNLVPYLALKIIG